MNGPVNITITAPGIAYTLNDQNHPHLAKVIEAMIGAGRTAEQIASEIRTSVDDALVALHAKVGAAPAPAADTGTQTQGDGAAAQGT